MSRLHARVIIVLVALANAACFIAYQRRDWADYWTDQNGYFMLGKALAETGTFTRYPHYERFIPEVMRTPGYPLFVASVSRTLGDGHLPVAIAQAFVFAGICLLVYAITRGVASDRVAFAAGLVTALYPTLPYFGALTMSDVVTAFAVTFGSYCWLRGARDGGIWPAAAGVVFAAASLTRPNFQFLPVAFVLFAWLVAPRTALVRRRGLVMIVAFAVAVAPWVARNVRYFGSVNLAPPAAGIGRTMWEGYWQVVFPGRVEARLTELAETIWDRTAVDREVRQYADSLRMDAEPMLRYVHEWQDVRRMWDEPKDPPVRAAARIAADGEYGRLARENIGRDPVRHLWRRLTLGIALLWITEIPVRYSDINRLPPLAIRAMWGLQALVTAAAFGGLYVLWRRGARTEAAALAAVFVYITAVHVVLYSEARYTLPVRPLVLVAAVVAVSGVVSSKARSDKLPPSQSQTEA